jgi:hypothetical protein
MQNKTCSECKQNFILEQVDLDFYKKIDVCIPAMCPLCRAQIRLAFRNEMNLYHRKCDKTGENIISVFSQNKPDKVYSYDAWFADDWDATEYGREYDPNRPFFDQLKELFDAVPKPALSHTRSVNSEYLNLAADNKNAYMIFESSNNEDATNCYWIQKCKDIADTSYSDSCELCVECDDCFNCYRVSNARGAHNCSDCSFLFDCRGLSNCIGCVNLYQGEYYILNQKYSKEEFEIEKKKLALDTYSGRQAFQIRFNEFLKTQPQKYAEIVNCVGSSGNFLKNTKNCTYTFHGYDAEECRYTEHVWRNAKECVDVSTTGRNAELMYNTINTALDVSHCICTAICWTDTFAEYSMYCFNSNYVLGCFGLRKKEYCILNKQYSKEEFEKLRLQIKENMKQKGEWGNWYPKNMSFFGYNESSAQSQFPLTKEQAGEKSYSWEDTERGTFGKETTTWTDHYATSSQINDDILKEIFACTQTGKNFRFTSHELNLYKKLSLPLPRLHPDVRLETRLKARGENRLYKRVTQDGKEVLTPIPETNPRPILSDEAYKQEFM